MKNKVAFAISAAFVVSMCATATAAEAEECAAQTSIVSALSPTSISISASEVSTQSMQALWDIVAQSPRQAIPILGKVIADGQRNSFAPCTYPGIGLGVSSGGSPDRRSVTFCLWATETNTVLARQSVLIFIGAAEATTTTTTVPPLVADTATQSTSARSEPATIRVTTSTFVEQVVHIIAPVLANATRSSVAVQRAAPRIIKSKPKIAQRSRATSKLKKVKLSRTQQAKRVKKWQMKQQQHRSKFTR